MPTPSAAANGAAAESLEMENMLLAAWVGYSPMPPWPLSSSMPSGQRNGLRRSNFRSANVLPGAVYMLGALMYPCFTSSVGHHRPLGYPEFATFAAIMAGM